MSKFISRKLLITIVIFVLVAVLPIIYKDKGISDQVMMIVLGIIGGVGAGYGIIQGALDKKGPVA